MGNTNMSILQNREQSGSMASCKLGGVFSTLFAVQHGLLSRKRFLVADRWHGGPYSNHQTRLKSLVVVHVTAKLADPLSVTR